MAAGTEGQARVQLQDQRLRIGRGVPRGYDPDALADGNRLELRLRQPHPVLLGHGLELARGSNLSSHLDFDRLPLLPGVADLARAGHTTGASTRNWASYGGEVELGEGCSDWQRAILTDPQTSGGLLVSCAADTADAVLAIFARHGFTEAGVIGRLEAGAARVVVAI